MDPARSTLLPSTVLPSTSLQGAALDRRVDTVLDFLLSGEFPGDGKPKPVVIPVPSTVSIAGEKYRVVSLLTLLELKLTSGMTAPHRMQDLTDVLRLIHEASLPRQLSEQLNPYVQEKYLELWQLAQYPDEE